MGTQAFIVKSRHKCKSEIGSGSTLISMAIIGILDTPAGAQAKIQVTQSQPVSLCTIIVSRPELKKEINKVTTRVQSMVPDRIAEIVSGVMLSATPMPTAVNSKPSRRGEESCSPKPSMLATTIKAREPIMAPAGTFKALRSNPPTTENARLAASFP